MHTIREIMRLATMLAGLITPRHRLGHTQTTPHLRFDYSLASISCKHCRSSRNNPHCAPRHVIYYSSNEEIIAATNEYFDGLNKNYILEGIKRLKCLYNKCLQLKGDYVEK